MSVCECESCEEEAVYYDHMDNKVCEDHMMQDLSEDDQLSPEDFELIEREE